RRDLETLGHEGSYFLGRARALTLRIGGPPRATRGDQVCAWSPLVLMLRSASALEALAGPSAEHVLLAGADRDVDALALGRDVARVDADDQLVVAGAGVDVSTGEVAL